MAGASFSIFVHAVNISYLLRYQAQSSFIFSLLALFMSFLLDALGKADNDRRRAAVPELRTRGHKRNTPTRKAFRIVLLMFLALISFVLGFLSRPYIEPGYTISIIREESNAVALSDADGDKSRSAPLNIAEKEKLQPSLVQQIELSVISYSSVPTERFAMLNGFLMYEGDILSAGERLIEIQPDGVLLEKDGRQYNVGMATVRRP